MPSASARSATPAASISTAQPPERAKFAAFPRRCAPPGRWSRPPRNGTARRAATGAAGQRTVGYDESPYATTISATASFAVQRAAESGAHHGVGRQLPAAASTAAAARFRPDSIGGKYGFMPADASGARPIDGQRQRAHLPGVATGCRGTPSARMPRTGASFKRRGRGRDCRSPRTTPRREPAPCRAGPGSKPSSRRAFSCVTHIFFRAMRTASSGTRGGVPVTPAQAVLHTPAHYATAYGSRTAGAFRPVISASFSRICASVRFSEPRI